MANTTLNMQLLLRRDQVFTTTYVLAAGEPGFEISTNTFKVGDGTKTWAELPFANKEQVEAILDAYYTSEEVDALIKAVDDKVAALNNTYATDAEVETIRAALQAAVDTKLAAETFNTYSATRQLTDTEINTAIGNVDAKFASYRTSADQDVIDNGIKGRLDTLEAKPFDTYATKTEVQAVADDVTEINTELDTFGDIVTHNAAEFETAGAAAEAEGRINETLKGYYTKTEADAAFTTPAEVIAEVNKALSEVSDADTINNITALVEYVNEHGADLTELVTEVYGSAEMTGDSRLDTIEAKAAMGITADDIAAWNAEKGVKAIVDANKATWDKAGTALQAADLADYAKTADVVTNEEFTAFEATNTEAIGKKLDTATFEAFNNGDSKDVAAIEADIVAKADAAQAAAEKVATDFNTAMDARVAKLEGNEAGYATTGEVATAKQEAIDAAKQYADGLDHEDTTYTFAPTANALEFTVTPDGKGEAQTVTLVAPTVDTGIMSVEAGEDIVVTPGENGKVTVAHETFTTGEYTKDPATSDKTGDQYFFTGVTVDNGHMTGANVKSLASVLEAMTFVLDGGTSAN